MSNECFKVPKVTKEEHEAIQRVYDGAASAYQQRLVLKVICNKFARANDMLFIAGDNGDRETAFLNGRSFVGAQVMKHINIPVGQLVTEDKHDE